MKFVWTLLIFTCKNWIRLTISVNFLLDFHETLMQIFDYRLACMNYFQQNEYINPAIEYISNGGLKYFHVILYRNRFYIHIHSWCLYIWNFWQHSITHLNLSLTPRILTFPIYWKFNFKHWLLHPMAIYLNQWLKFIR